MSDPMPLFLLSAALLLAGAVWRELRVPASGSLREGRTAAVLATASAVSVILTAIVTYRHLIEAAS